MKLSATYFSASVSLFLPSPAKVPAYIHAQNKSNSLSMHFLGSKDRQELFRGRLSLSSWPWGGVARKQVQEAP